MTARSSPGTAGNAAAGRGSPGTAGNAPVARSSPGTAGPPIETLGEHETLRTGAGIWAGLLVSTLLLAQTGTPPQTTVLSLIVVTLVLLVTLRWRAGGLAILTLVAVGVLLRTDATGMGASDVLTVTRAAIDMMTVGGNPYGHGFAESTPPGAPFAYGPLALLWYLPVRDLPVAMEFVISIGLMAVFALRGRVLGLAVYATLPALVLTAHDGSNDTSAGLLLLASLLVAERSPRAGAAVLAAAVAFKPYALAWLPPLVAYGGLETLLPFAVVSVLIWGPAVALWGWSNLLWSFREADAIHHTRYYSLAYALGDHVSLPRGFYEVFRYAAGLATAVVSWLVVRRSPTHRALVLGGIPIFFVTLFFGWWSTIAYVAAIAPIVCWHLDDWLGLPHVAWPGDPVGRLSDAVEGRWPRRRPRRSAATA